MKKFLILCLPIYFLGLIYLLLPSPSTPVVPNSFKSDEPGDTIQNPNQPAYYTDYSRAEVLTQAQDQFSLQFLGFTLPSYRLNYRPEESTQFVREQLLTYYLEEVVLPFRESLFVNGWNPRLSPITFQLFERQYDRWAMIREGREYQSKVTFRPYFSSPLARLFIWTSLFPLAWLLIKQIRLSAIDFAKSFRS